VIDPDGRPGVVRVITRLNIGGPARQALMLTRSLDPGWRTVLVAGDVAPDEGELSDPLVPVTRVPLVRPLRPATDARAYLALRRLLRDAQPAIVHTHMAKAGTLGRLATRGTDTRTVHTFHGHVLESYFSAPVQRAFIEVERRLAARTDALVAVSDEVRDDLLALDIGTPEQFRVIRLGFDLTSHLSVTGPSGILRERLGLDGDTPLVGAVGRLVPIKDITTLLHAVALLPDDVHLVLVGDGSERGPLEAEVERRSLGDRVHFTGWMTDVPAVMADLDVVALSSRNEGTPVALIEAAACGRPAVATDVGGVRSVVADGETGLVVPPADPRQLADALERLLSDPGLGAAMGATGRARSSRFSAERLTTDIDALYRALL
jgi:glycosyltransferase involved in cell wall biosynthesis